jgi:hypothetical protein
VHPVKKPTGGPAREALVELKAGSPARRRLAQIMGVPAASSPASRRTSRPEEPVITPQLTAIGVAVTTSGSADALRKAFPGVHFTECSADDVSPRYKVALSVTGYDLYLVSGASVTASNSPATWTAPPAS